MVGPFVHGLLFSFCIVGTVRVQARACSAADRSRAFVVVCLCVRTVRPRTQVGSLPHPLLYVDGELPVSPDAVYEHVIIPALLRLWGGVRLVYSDGRVIRLVAVVFNILGDVVAGYELLHMLSARADGCVAWLSDRHKKNFIST